MWGAISSKAFSITLLNLANSSMSAFSLALPAGRMDSPSRVPPLSLYLFKIDLIRTMVYRIYGPVFPSKEVNLSISKI